MKKIIIFTILVAFVFVSGPALAALSSIDAGGEITTGTNDDEPNTVIAVLSNNVYAQILASVGQFSAQTKHINGSKNYATSSESTKILWKLVATANEKTAVFEVTTLQASDTSDFSAWDAL